MPTPSALKNYSSAPGILVGENFGDFLETNFQKINESLMTQEPEGLKMYLQEDTSLDHMKSTSLVDFGLMPKSRDSQDVPQDTPIQGFDNTYTPETYRLGYRYEKRLQETAQYGFISKVQRGLMQSFNDTIEYHAALPFITTFGSDVTFLCADGLALVDTARNLEDGSGTWTNQETAAALTQNSLETMDNNFANNVNGRGFLRPLMMKRLVVPRELRRKALELTQSDKRPEDSLNAKNIFNGSFDVIVWNYLTSPTNWFGTTEMTEPKYQLRWVWGARKEVQTYKGENPDVTNQRIRAVWVTGCDRPHGIRGNPA